MSESKFISIKEVYRFISETTESVIFYSIELNFSSHVFAINLLPAMDG